MDSVSTPPRTLSAVPHHERRIVKVVPGLKAAQLHELATQLRSIPAILPTTKAAVTMWSGRLGVSPDSLISVLRAGPIQQEQLDEWTWNGCWMTRSDSERKLGILRVTQALAQRELKLPPGHPVINAPYAAHPLVPNRYYPLANFHQVLFEEKLNELVTLLASLGATRVIARCLQGYRSSIHGAASLMTPQGPVGGSVNYAGSHTSGASFEETFAPQGRARVPDGLLWFEHEPSWQALVRRRLEFGAASFKTQLAHTDDYGIGAEVGAMLFGGINAGATVFQATVWEFEGEFAPIS